MKILITYLGCFIICMMKAQPKMLFGIGCGSQDVVRTSEDK